MSRRKAALAFSFLMMASLLNSAVMEYENLEESSTLKSTISSDYGNISVVQIGPSQVSQGEIPEAPSNVDSDLIEGLLSSEPKDDEEPGRS